MNREEGRNGVLEQALSSLGISKEECYLAQEFIYKQAGEDVPKGIQPRDLTAVSDKVEETFEEAFRAVRKLRRKEAEGRLFTLLFAIGQESCYRLVPEEIVNGEKNSSGIAPEQKAAVYAAKIGADLYSIGWYKLCTLIEVAENDPEVLKKALCCGNGKMANSKVILLTVYFLTKYGKSEAGEEMLDAGDAAWMQQYEEIVTGNFQGYMERERKKRTGPAAGGSQKQQNIPPEYRLKTSDLEHLFYLTAGMAYLNFRLSKRLKELVRESLAAEPGQMLDIFLAVSEKLAMDIRIQGGAFDREFGLAPQNYIYWAARRGLKEILEVQFQNNREDYQKVLMRVESEYFRAQAENDHRSWRVADNAMQAKKADKSILETVEKCDPALYQELMAKRRQDGGRQEMDQLIAAVVPKFEDAEVIKAYLYGQKEIDDLYSCLKRLQEQNDSSARWMQKLLSVYLEKYENEGFHRRCQVLMLLWHTSCSEFFFHHEIENQEGEKREIQPQLVKELFRNFSLEKVEISYQLQGVVYLGEWYADYYGQEIFLDSAQTCFAGYLREQRQKTLAAFAESGAFGRFFGLRVLRQEAEENKKEIFRYTQDTAKIVKRELLDILCEKREWEEDVKQLLSSKKAAEREIGVRVLTAWQEAGTNYKELFFTAAEKEKNSKIREFLENAMAAAPEGGAKVLSREELVAQLHKGNRKRRLAWAYETPFSAVHFAADLSAASEEYLQAILLCYAAGEEERHSFANGEQRFVNKERGYYRNAEFLVSALVGAEFAVYVNELFDKWLAAGGESKKDWVLYAAAIHGGAGIIEKLESRIAEWPRRARWVLACEAVRALACSPLPQALLVLDGIAREFRYKQVRAAANEAMEFAAKQAGVSREELADRIVPDFGFDENAEKYFDYGTRGFYAVLTPDLRLALYEAERAPEEEGETKESRMAARGRERERLPAPGKKDNAKMAAAAYEEWKQLKKQLKAAVNSQKRRLEEALWSAREWDVNSWKLIFVKNPLMRLFAGGLIWGIYRDGKLEQSFRYMEDGSFNTPEEEEYILPEAGKIALVHPLDLAKAVNMAWRQQLADYEIVPPFDQLTRPVYRIAQEEAGKKELARFCDRVVNNISFCGSLAESGWHHGPAEDAGIFRTWYREDMQMGLGVELDFSGSYVEEWLDEDVTVYGARFYRVEKGKSEADRYGRMDEDKIFELQTVPQRYFSEVIRQMVQAAGTDE